MKPKPSRSALALLAIVATAVIMFGAGCVVKVPLAKGNTDLVGPDYTSTNTLAPRIKPMFALDGKLNVFSAWRARVFSLSKNVTVLYFRPRTEPVTDATLDAQMRDIWKHFEPGLSTGDLDVLIIRGVPPPPSWKMYSYAFLKDDRGQWGRVQDADQLDTIIQAESIMWATLT